MFMASDAGWQALLRDGDTGIHIRIGDLILASHHVPSTDPFSFSKPGKTWFAHEWLTEVLYALLVRAGGLKAWSCSPAPSSRSITPSCCWIS